MTDSDTPKSFWQWFVEKALVPIIVVLISVFGTYYLTSLSNRPAQPSGEVRIETFPTDIFSFAGNNNPEGGWAGLTLTYEKPTAAIYNLAYSLPTEANANGYAGLTFKFKTGQDLSGFKAVAFTVSFKTPEDKIYFVIKDIAYKEVKYQVVGNGQPQMSISLDLSTFQGVNLKAVQELLFFADTALVTGDHQISISNLRLLR